MSTEFKDAYQEMYLEYISLMVNLHNSHSVFMTHPTYGQATEIRRNLKKMKILGKSIAACLQWVIAEHIEKIPGDAARRKEEIHQKMTEQITRYSNRAIKTKLKGNENGNNDSTKNDV